MADCERIHDGLLAEPVNALSSLAYVAAGVWTWRRDRPRGAALVAVGLGSIAYHARGGTAARWLHDLTIVAVAAVVAASAPQIMRGARERPRVAAVAIGAFALALPLQLFGRTGGSWCDPDRVLQPHAGWHVLTATALAAVLVLARRGDYRMVPACSSSAGG
jgi:hypothetical protein